MTRNDSVLRPTGLAKTKATTNQFAAIDITDYGRSVPEEGKL
ncbi:hypothetical protein RR49_00317 [Microbacterium ginsengisoli]|uniref:Uncharacterized protein n=1 Tax=Microbacterium ginsengisoli TaxID=400772 RepID=A0A0F0LXI2_9MICO|nr:hypothetical protein [Microbacterium ginsengisoli]KJL42019.1 hypothetical protein RR49_00317 [Microbacterium ginsengisoli]